MPTTLPSRSTSAPPAMSGADGDAGLEQPGDVDAGTGVDHHVAVGDDVDADAVVEAAAWR